MARSRVFLSCAIVLALAVAAPTLALVVAAPALAQDQAPVPPSDLTGDWSLAMEGPQGMVRMTLKLVQEDNQITGTLDGPMGLLELAGEIEEGEVSFWASVETPNGGFELRFTGTVEENQKIVGWMEAGGGEVSTEFTAQRVEKS